jgi:hypothetical protein
MFFFALLPADLGREAGQARASTEPGAGPADACRPVRILPPGDAYSVFVVNLYVVSRSDKLRSFNTHMCKVNELSSCFEKSIASLLCRVHA